MRSTSAGIRQVMLSLRSCFMRYHPEKHYMRGPGPKTLSKLGEAFRADAEAISASTIQMSGVAASPDPWAWASTERVRESR
jgi:hypothetical protein